MYSTIANTIHDTDPNVTIVAVSKTRTTQNIAQVVREGGRHFGENYLQEAQQKITALKNSDIQWHFIGAVQSNKTANIAAMFDWVQTVDRVKIAHRLNEQRKPSMSRLNVCIQVNADEESQKAGCSIETVPEIAHVITQLTRLRLRGIMVIPKQQDTQQTRATFRRMKQLFTQLQAHYPSIDTLSMGMSKDYRMAIEEGATMIRLGTALFGTRETRKEK